MRTGRPCGPAAKNRPTALVIRQVRTIIGQMRVVLVSKALVVGAYQRKAEEIAACGVELTVLTPPSWRDRRGTQLLEPSHLDGYTLRAIPIRRNGHFHTHFYPTLGRELAALKPDVLHMDEEPYNFATWHAFNAARKQKLPATFFTWQNILRRYPPPFRWMEQSCYKRAPVAIAGNQEAATVLQHKGYTGHIAVIPQFGVDPRLFAPRQNDAAEPPQGVNFDAHCDQHFVVGYAGGLLPEKGLDTLLHAVAARNEPWRLRLAGQGEAEGALRALAATLGITDRVEFVGKVESDAMPDFYRTLDVFVLPSRTTPSWKEQFGRVLIEAMAAGVVVVGSDSGEIPHVIGDAGCIFPEGDVAALHEHLAALQQTPARRAELAAAGRTRVQAAFTMQSIAARTVEVYRQLCA